MCYTFTIASAPKILKAVFKVEFPEEKKFKPIFNCKAFNLPETPVICSDDPSNIKLVKWGLIPYWAKDTETAEKMRKMTFNAKAETIFDKASFKVPAKKKHCLILANGFFEWRQYKGDKYPYFIYHHDKKPFAIAGLYDDWTNKNTGEIIRTYSIITTKANDLLSKIHNSKKRMPVILNKNEEKDWLNATNKKEAVKILKSCAENALNSHTVSKLVTANKAESYTNAIFKKFTYKNLPSL